MTSPVTMPRSAGGTRVVLPAPGAASMTRRGVCCRDARIEGSRVSTGRDGARFKLGCSLNFFVMGQSPLGAGVGDMKAGAFGIALGLAAGFSDHHGEFLAMVEGVLETGLEERGLQAMASEFRHGRGTAK